MKNRHTVEYFKNLTKFLEKWKFLSEHLTIIKQALTERKVINSKRLEYILNVRFFLQLQKQNKKESFNILPEWWTIWLNVGLTWEKTTSNHNHSYYIIVIILVNYSQKFSTNYIFVLFICLFLINISKSPRKRVDTVGLKSQLETIVGWPLRVEHVSWMRLGKEKCCFFSDREDLKRRTR